MKLIAKTMGALALQILLAALLLIIIGTALWLIVPIAFPVSFTWTNGLGVASLLYIAKAVFK